LFDDYVLILTARHGQLVTIDAAYTHRCSWELWPLQGCQELSTHCPRILNLFAEVYWTVCHPGTAKRGAHLGHRLLPNRNWCIYVRLQFATCAWNIDFAPEIFHRWMQSTDSNSEPNPRLSHSIILPV